MNADQYSERRSAVDLLTEPNASDESPRIEAKRAREIGKSIMETVIAFANEPGLGGGYLLLGVDAKALIYARETGMVDNTACRDLSGLDTLQASNVLRRLRDRGLLEKQGAGNRTHYTLVNPESATSVSPEQRELPLDSGRQTPEGGRQELPPLPSNLAQRLPVPGKRTGETALRQLILDLCGWHALRGDELAAILGKDLKYLRNRYLSAMVQSGELVFQYPKSPSHKRQAYKLPEKP
jgi:ATP-dependent DNA helicase RecG